MIFTADIPEMYNSEAPESHYEFVINQNEGTNTDTLDIEQNVSSEAAPTFSKELSDISGTTDLPVILTLTDADLLARAQEIVAIFADGFQWSDLAQVIEKSYSFLHDYQGLSADDRKECVIKIIDYTIDITDTPYLPDRISDPIFKKMVAPFVDLMGFAIEGAVSVIPSSDSHQLTADELKAFVDTLKDSFIDGFQWSDIATCVRASIEFLGVFPSMTLQEKQACVIQVIDDIIDSTDVPYLPNAIADPIFKAMVNPIIMFIFSKIAQ